MNTLEQHQSNLAERAFAEYDFGNGVEVTDTGGWVHVSPSNERSRKVYYECEREDDGPAPRGTLTFTVRFAQSGRSLEEAYAIDGKGQIWGCMPGREKAEASEIPGQGEYQSYLYDGETDSGFIIRNEEADQFKAEEWRNGDIVDNAYGTYAEMKAWTEAESAAHDLWRAESGYVVFAQEDPMKQRSVAISQAMEGEGALEHDADPEGAKLFFFELLASVETLYGIAEKHGLRTLVDLMYLQQAILKGETVEVWPGETEVGTVIQSLPSADRWFRYTELGGEWKNACVRSNTTSPRL